MKNKLLSARGLFLQGILALSLALGLVMISTSAQAGTMPPAVDAGDPQTVTAGSTVTLQGSATPIHCCVDTVHYAWSLTSGPSVTWLDPASGSVTKATGRYDGGETATFPAVTFTAPATAGTLVFNLAAYPDTAATYATGNDNVTIEVVAPPTPAEATTALIGKVQALVDADILNGGQGNALISKLNGVLAKLTAGQTQPAINKLQAFINQVQALVNGRTLTTAQGQPLLDAAMNIVTQLGA